MDAAGSDIRLGRRLHEVVAPVRASWGRRVLAAAAVPGIALAAVLGRPSTMGLALGVGLGVPVSLLPVTLLVPFLLLRPRPYEDMPRSAFAAVLAAPLVLIVGYSAALLQALRNHTGPATWTAWASNLSNVLCLAWAIVRDSYMQIAERLKSHVVNQPQ